jgi:MoaA/NifB/PqqE/SkfB family radical SAM enzyme
VDGLAPNFQELMESPRILRPLDRLVLEVTVYCNLKCKMCSVWEVRENGVPLQLAKQLLEDAYRLGARSFVPYGAENFMRKDFVDMVEHAHAIGYELQPIVTNGTMITEENLERLSRCPSARLSISIDVPAPFTTSCEAPATSTNPWPRPANVYAVGSGLFSPASSCEKRWNISPSS